MFGFVFELVVFCGLVLFSLLVCVLVWVVCLFVVFVVFDVGLRVFTDLDTLFNGCCLCRAFGRFD